MEYVGHGDPGDAVVVRGSLADREFIAFWHRDGVVTAAMNVNVWDVVEDLKAIVAAGHALEPGRSPIPPSPSPSSPDIARTRAPPTGVPMTKLQRLYANTARVPGSTTSRAATCATAPSPRMVGRRDPRRDRQPDDLRQRDRRLRRLRRAVLVAARRRAARSRTPTGSSSSPTSPTRSPCCGRSSTPATGPTASSPSRSPPNWPTTPRPRSPPPADLHARIDEPNLLVKIPATAEGVPAIQAMIAEGRSINVTLIFSLARYAEVIDAYLSGLETSPTPAATRRRCTASPRSSSAASTPRSTAAWRHSATTQALGVARPRRRRPGEARLPALPRAVLRRHAGSAWPRSARTVQRPAVGVDVDQEPRATPTRSTSTASSGPTPSPRCPRPPSPLRGPRHASPARSTSTWTRRTTRCVASPPLGVDMDDVGLTLENQGIASFHESFRDVLAALDAKARHTGGH